VQTAYNKFITSLQETACQQIKRQLESNTSRFTLSTMLMRMEAMAQQPAQLALTMPGHVSLEADSEDESPSAPEDRAGERSLTGPPRSCFTVVHAVVHSSVSCSCMRNTCCANDAHECEVLTKLSPSTGQLLFHRVIFMLQATQQGLRWDHLQNCRYIWRMLPYAEWQYQAPLRSSVRCDESVCIATKLPCSSTVFLNA
jgi:hypothetical protein